MYRFMDEHLVEGTLQQVDLTEDMITGLKSSTDTKIGSSQGCLVPLRSVGSRCYGKTVLTEPRPTFGAQRDTALLCIKPQVHFVSGHQSVSNIG